MDLVRGPHQNFGDGHSFLVNCYLQIKFLKITRLTLINAGTCILMIYKLQIIINIINIIIYVRLFFPLVGHMGIHATCFTISLCHLPIKAASLYDIFNPFVKHIMVYLSGLRVDRMSNKQITVGNYE